MQYNRVRIALTLTLTLVFLIISTGRGVAWSNGGYSSDPADPDYGTHDWIADAALGIQTRDVGFLKTTYHSQFLLGTEAPDNPDYIGDTGKHHVYYFANGSVQDDAAAFRAKSIAQSALAYLKSDDLLHASFEIGVMTHYISDVGVFGHTMGTATAWGTELHHSDYESEVNSIVSSLDFPTSLTLGNTTPYDSALTLAKDITFGKTSAGVTWSNVEMDDHYNWANSTFRSCSFSSMNQSVRAVASAINNLLVEAGVQGQAPIQPIPNPQPQPAPQNPASSQPPQTDSTTAILIVLISAGGVWTGVGIYWARGLRKH